VTGGGGRGGGPGGGGAEAEAGEGLLPGTGALVEDGGVDLEGRERVGVGAGPRRKGVRGGGGERVQVGQRERPDVHHGKQLRRHWVPSASLAEETRVVGVSTGSRSTPSPYLGLVSQKKNKKMSTFSAHV